MTAVQQGKFRTQIRAFFTDREYYRQLVFFALPLALQNLVISSLNMVGVVMIGQLGETPVAIPRATAHGSLVNYICHAELKTFQPANITFDLLEQLDEATRKKVRDKKIRHKMVCDRALEAFDQWMAAERVAT